MKNRSLAALATAVVLASTGCSSTAEKPAEPAETSASSTTTTASSSTTSATASPSASVSSSAQSTSASPASSQTVSCGNDNEQQALDNGFGQLLELSGPEGNYHWAKDYTDSNYDPCAELSWAVVGIQGGTASSPYQIMLFHRGEYLGTATKHAYGFAPKVERVSDGEIAVTYRWPKDGESNAEASNTATAHFAWDKEKNSVVMSGNLPAYGPTENGTTPLWEKAIAHGAAPQVGGGIPKNAQPMQESKEIKNTFVFKTPSENIGCDATSTTLSCGVLSWSKTQTPAAGSVFPPDWLLTGIGETATPEETTRGDAMTWGISPDAAPVLEYGESAYYENFVCSSEINGLTCWNTLSGHGAFLNADGYVGF